MDLREALLNRRTVYKFKPEPVPRALLDRALEAARWAPVHKLTDPWRFLVTGPETRARLGKVARRLAHKKAGDAQGAQLAAILDKQEAKLRDLPALVVVTANKSPDDAFREREDYAAVCCAIQNAQLQLWADGLACQWGTGGPTRDDETYAILGVDAAEAEIVGFLKVGYALEVPTTKRKPLDEVVRDLP